MEYNQRMSIFNYTLPSGAKFRVVGPAGATQAQADRVFYEQVASGSLVGYETGQTLTSAASKVVKFELSRLERGTAGVENPTALAVVLGLPIVTSIPDLVNVPLTNPINQADIVLAKGGDLVPDPIGPLSSDDVQKLLAQITNFVNQNANEVTLEKGIGKYGLTAYQLEQAGYVKPGTSAKYLSNDRDSFVNTMNTPSVWTGLGGVTSLDNILADETLQNNIQTNLMTIGFNSLQAAGVIRTVPSAQTKASQGTIYTNNGLQTFSSLAQLGGSLALSLLSRPGSFQLPNLSTIASGVTNGLTSGLSNLGGLANLNVAGIGSGVTGITNQITGQIGALVANASKFGGDAAALWAGAGGLGNVSALTGSLTNIAGGSLTNLAGGITGSLQNLTGGFGSSLNGIASNLTNLNPGSLGNLTGSMDLLGKASQFATNFNNPLSSLSSLPSLESLQGQLSGLASGLSGNFDSLVSSFSNFDFGGFADFAGGFGDFGGFGGGGGDLVSGTQVAAGFNNTVNRKTVDAATKRFIGSNKIPLPAYEYPGFTSNAELLDIQQAEAALQSSDNSGFSTAV
jgi:hypothetical protein